MMERVVGNFRPSVCFEVEKVIGVSVGEGNVKNYQVQWAPAWVSGTTLLGCEHLIEQFLKEQKDEQQQLLQKKHQHQQQQHQQQQQQLQQQQHQLQQQQQQLQQQQLHQQQDAPPVIINVVDYGAAGTVDPKVSAPVQNTYVERPTMLLSNGTSSRVLSPIANNANMNITVCRVVEPAVQNLDLIKTEHIRELSNDDDVENFIATQPRPSNSTAVEEEVEGEQEEQSIRLIPADTLEMVPQPGPNITDTKSLTTSGTHCIATNTLFQTPENVYISMDYCDVDTNTIAITTAHDLVQQPITTIETAKPRISTKNEVFPCPECGKTFKHRSALVRHRQLHNKVVRPWVCPQCLKPFTSKGAMDRHQLLHTGNKAYTCAECDKSFSRKDALTRHFRQHTGEKPYKCGQCGKAFTDNSSYRVHMTKFHQDTTTPGY